MLFDDCNCIVDPKINKAVQDILNEALQIGRHLDLEVLNISHIGHDSHRTKYLMAESHYFVFFPRGQFHRTHYMLKNYLGIDKHMIQKLKKINSRWVVVSVHHPAFFMSEHGVGLLNLLE